MPGEIELFQEKALAETLQYLESKSVFYKNHFKTHGIAIDKIKHLSDLAHIPPTRKEDLQAKA